LTQYHVYIDDSGTKEYADDPAEYGISGKSRYFVLGAVLLTQVNSGHLVRNIRALKTEYFGTDKVEIKSHWLRQPDKKQKNYLKKYSISDDTLTEFVHKYYDIIVQTDLQLIGVVIDKLHMQEKYPQPWHTSAVAYEVLMQRVVTACCPPHEVEVFIDNMTGATPAHNQYHHNLIKQHHKLKTNPSAMSRGFDFSPLKEPLRFVDSAHSHQVQVADIVAYNVNRQFRDHGEAWESKLVRPLPTYDWFMRLARKFRQGPDRRVQGYGIVKFPKGNSVRWHLVERNKKET